MELYARKVKPEGKDGFESKLKDLVEPFNLFSFIVTLNQDCYKLLVIILKTLQAMCIFLLLWKQYNNFLSFKFPSFTVTQ